MPDDAPELLTLTVNPRGRVYLSRALALHLGLRHGQPIALMRPRRGGQWHLHVPTQADAPLPRLTLYTGKNYKPQFKSGLLLSPTYFRRPASKGKGLGELLPLLTLELLPADCLTVSGFLPLRPLYANAKPSEIETQALAPRPA